ncbi:putative NADH-dependent oxidoreductase [Sphingobium herbicidovorans NBRC 16415]|uniref:NADH-dependent oxidoreductase n=1 Tax=Sphingobium herbicidovorans (strain ATCC 700291 / DSM 11019 / CCUG 56400 / KCTC 2939 / LMG 18315 / NBRC 16415 / MH) TaxID=1219045 RepID=A0A086PC52_SPHHM|nr:FAD-dependent oxidoreductase [Sphingobium herbicidovorans]KFG90970.1 putative NADH-dependent oxidoreductase [Sphingobium herbicidovorans NBRC 16415]
MTAAPALSQSRPGAVPAMLNSPGQIGTLTLPNRIIVTAMGVSLAEADGTVGQRLIDYHVAQAKGGAGLIVMGVTGVAWPVGAVQPRQTAISDDRFLPGLTRLVDAVHAAGGLIAAQLHHGGLVATHSAQDGHPLWGPAYPPAFAGDFPDYFLPEEMAAFAGGVVPQVKVLEKADIDLAVRQFAEAGVRAQRAGMDGAEIHGGHGYLLSSFVSPSTNTRQDEYGGDVAGRARLLLEVVRAVRAAVGPDFPLWVKIDSREIGKKNGITLENAIELAPMVEAAGANALTVTAYHDVGQGKLHSASNIPHEPGAHLQAAAAIRKAVSIPVIASGRVEIERGEKGLAQGEFDFLAMGRKLLADPDLPIKMKEGRIADIRPCIYCYTCVSTAYLREQVRCAVRSETGYEDLDWSPAKAPGHVVIIGGGPGGMEAARRLDLAGAKVTLIEKSDRLGGTLRFAALAYEPNERLLNWLRHQIGQSRVDVRLKTMATPEMIASLKPDKVIVATGAVRDMPPIPGNDQDFVLSGDDLRGMMLGEDSAEIRRKTSWSTRIATKLGAATGATANLDLVRKATHAWMPLGKRVVIIGGELVGVELAEFLMERGREVTVVGEAPKFGGGLLLVRRMRLLAELREHGVAMFAGSSAITIGKNEVSFTDAEGQPQSIPADHVVVAMGAHGDSTLADALRAGGHDVVEVGDGTGVTYIEGAIRGAAEAVAAMGR